jgi:site-specific DNA-methyltransferase (adenine-specific)
VPFNTHPVQARGDAQKQKVCARLEGHPMEQNQVTNADCLPVLASMTDLSIDVVITDPPYPNGSGLFPESLIDGIAALYLCAKKAKRYVIFFWSPVMDAPPAPPGWFHTATHIWEKPDCKTSIRYEHIIVWSRDYKRQPYKVWTVPILDYRTLKDWQPSHPTQKPVRLLRYLVEDYTKPGDLVLDPCAGTGTTIVACKQTGRECIGIEKDATFAEFARQRLAGPRDIQAKLDTEQAPTNVPPASTLDEPPPAPQRPVSPARQAKKQR